MQTEVNQLRTLVIHRQKYPGDADLWTPGAPQPGEGASSVSSASPSPFCDFIVAVEPKMPTLRQVHEIVAADPGAQANFFLLMSELHYRFILGIERLHIGRVTLARPPHPPHDLIASSLQPCLCPGTMDCCIPAYADVPVNCVVSVCIRTPTCCNWG